MLPLQKVAPKLRSVDEPLSNRSFLNPQSWGIQPQNVTEMCAQDLLLQSSNVRPGKQTRRAASTIPVWDTKISQTGLLDSKLRSAACENESIEANHAAKYGLCSIVPSEGAAPLLPSIVSSHTILTPAAGRILARQEFLKDLRQKSAKFAGLKSIDVARQDWITPIPRYGRTSPTLWSLLKDTKGTTWDCAWKAMIWSSEHKESINAPKIVRESHTTSLIVRKQSSGMLSLQGSRTPPLDALIALSEPQRYEQSANSFQFLIRSLLSAGRYSDVATKICNLRIIRRIVSAKEDEKALADLETLYSEVCSELETAIKFILHQEGEQKTLDALAVVKEHRDFFKDFRRFFGRRPQSVLEMALTVKAKYPFVVSSAIELSRKCEKTAYELLEEYQSVMLHNIQSVVGTTKLAKIKAEIREIWLDGALTHSSSPHGIATKFRLLISLVCLRILQVRLVLVEEGIPIEGKVLNEIISEDIGIYPSDFDQEIAKQAIREARKALSGLEKETEQAMQEKNARNKKSLDQHKFSQDQESELSEIRNSKKEKELATIKKAADDVRQMKDAFCEEVWRSACGGTIAGKHGGAVAICGSLILATSNDSAIEVIDLATVMYKSFAKCCKLVGHSDKVVSLAACGTKLIFSGSMDNTIRLWDLEKFKCIQVLEGHTDVVSCLALATEDHDWEGLDGKYLCSGSFDATIRIWAVKDDDVDALADLAVLPEHKGRQQQDKSKPNNWQCIRVLFGHGCFIHSIVASGCTMYSGGEDGLIKIWSVYKKHSVGQLEGCRNIYCLCMPVGLLPGSDTQSGDPEQRHLLCSSGIDASITLWDLNSPDLLQDGLASKDTAVRHEFSPISELDELTTEAQSLRQKLSSVITPEGKSWLSGVLNEVEDRLKSASAKVASFQFVRDLQSANDLIYSAGAEDFIRIWSLESISCVGEINDVGGGIHGLAISSDYLASSCYDNCVRVCTTSENQVSFATSMLQREERLAEEGGLVISFAKNEELPLSLLPDILVRYISCGSEHGMMLDSGGSIWCWGSSDRGQLGTGNVQPLTSPEKVTFPDKYLRFKSISAGNFHSLAVGRSGDVWGWGDNQCGQLGLGWSEEAVAHIRQRETLAQNITLLGNKIYGIEAQVQTLERTAEGERSLALALEISSQKSNLKMLNEESQKLEDLLQALLRQLHPKKIAELQSHSINLVCAGGYHSIFVAEAGTVLTCGLGTHGQLGHPVHRLSSVKEGSYHLIKPVAISEPFNVKSSSSGSSIKIIEAAAGLLHSLFLSDEGKVFVCGRNTHGQLGLGNDSKSGQDVIATPIIISALSMHRIHSLAAGFFHSLFQSSRGDLWICGFSSHAAAQGDMAPMSLPGLDKERKLLSESNASSPTIRNPLVKIMASGCTSFVTSCAGNTYAVGPYRQISLQEMDNIVFERGQKIVQSISAKTLDPAKPLACPMLGNAPIIMASRFSSASIELDETTEEPTFVFITAECCLSPLTQLAYP